ncbi:hypothetical protein KFL_000680110 [Klebsormidium nitens]|uniref:Uncharacterized protein n=1 Tax=Klebsormidium nitens TaxID=105231 RepID=A0A0U9HS33_KLENI|nr:hypothetical protein KFL_000680110 [Klebsormidium nitens]|eukprot:GAQ80995.1 hypothetical protein KFL_000680110 [Klebsormidium nitens]
MAAAAGGPTPLDAPPAHATKEDVVKMNNCLPPVERLCEPELALLSRGNVQVRYKVISKLVQNNSLIEQLRTENDELNKGIKRVRDEKEAIAAEKDALVTTAREEKRLMKEEFDTRRKAENQLHREAGKKDGMEAANLEKKEAEDRLLQMMAHNTHQQQIQFAGRFGNLQWSNNQVLRDSGRLTELTPEHLPLRPPASSNILSPVVSDREASSPRSPDHPNDQLKMARQVPRQPTPLLAPTMTLRSKSQTAMLPAVPSSEATSGSSAPDSPEAAPRVELPRLASGAPRRKGRLPAMKKTNVHADCKRITRSTAAMACVKANPVADASLARALQKEWNGYRLRRRERRL